MDMTDRYWNTEVPDCIVSSFKNIEKAKSEILDWLDKEVIRALTDKVSDAPLFILDDEMNSEGHLTASIIGPENPDGSSAYHFRIDLLSEIKEWLYHYADINGPHGEDQRKDDLNRLHMFEKFIEDSIKVINRKKFLISNYPKDE